MGKQHGIDTSANSSKLYVKADIALSSTYVRQYVGVTDANANGYLMWITTSGSGGGLLYARIEKWYNGTNPYGGGALNVTETTLAISGSLGLDTNFYTYNLWMDQGKDGDPVILKLWSDIAGGGSFESPLLTAVDSSPLNLSGLSWIGVTYEIGSGGGKTARIDNILFTVIPEPSVAMLLGLGGLMFLRRAKGVRRGA
jgi:hypothetical protein